MCNSAHVHMNGRVYDPVIGKFLSADPFIQFPESTQGFNRYAYVGNNPLSANDPSGHFIHFFIAYGMITSTTATAMSIASGYLMMAGGIVSSIQAYQAGGFGGFLKANVIAGMSAAAAYGIGSGFEHASTSGQLVTKVLSHGVSQGAMSAAGGGRFGDGFLGGVAGSLVDFIDLPSGPIGVIAAAVLGGTVSKIGGGNFANGAISAAFVRAFNADGHPSGQRTGRPSEADTLLANPRFQEALTVTVSETRTAVALEGDRSGFGANPQRAGKPLGTVLRSDGEGGFKRSAISLDVPERGYDWQPAKGTVSSWPQPIGTDATAIVIATPAHVSSDAILSNASHYNRLSTQSASPVFVAPTGREGGTLYVFERGYMPRRIK